MKVVNCLVKKVKATDKVKAVVTHIREERRFKRSLETDLDLLQISPAMAMFSIACRYLFALLVLSFVISWLWDSISTLVDGYLQYGLWAFPFIALFSLMVFILIKIGSRKPTIRKVKF